MHRILCLTSCVKQRFLLAPSCFSEKSDKMVVYDLIMGLSTGSWQKYWATNQGSGLSL